MEYTIAIHGGAGTFTPGSVSKDMEDLYLEGLNAAVKAGQDILKGGGNALDAVCSAVRSLEDNLLFNAGRGSIFNSKGLHEMDAAVMDGSTRKAGAVAGVSGIKNPVLLARYIMDKTPHLFFTGEGARELADRAGIAVADENYFYDELRFRQWNEVRNTGKSMLDHSGNQKFGTVGAVARDKLGNLAAATSTGGMTNKMYGRVGDTPVIGAGTYANNLTCAVSCTGHGEYFIRAVAAYDVSCLMEYRGLSLEEACNEVVNNKLGTDGGEGGLIAVGTGGPPVLIFNCEGMYRGWVTEGGEGKFAIFR